MEDAILRIEAGLGRYKIETSVDGPDMIVRIHDGPDLVGTIWMIQGGHNGHKETIRSGKLRDVYAHQILSLGVEEPYRGQGFAKRLMIYGMCKMMLSAPSVHWWVLDDDSDASDPAHNIYTSFGFEPVHPSGPERQLSVVRFKRLLPSLLKPRKQFTGVRMRKRSRKSKSKRSKRSKSKK
jgi:GNAT superfamily N-acetyltransferase